MKKKKKISPKKIDSIYCQQTHTTRNVNHMANIKDIIASKFNFFKK